MGVLLLNWLLSALGLMFVAYLIPGFQVRGFGTALIAALVVGLVNATLGFILKIVTLPLSILTFGIFLVVINALMLSRACRRVLWALPLLELTSYDSVCPGTSSGGFAAHAQRAEGA